MTKDQKKQLEQLERLCSALADDIDAMTDEEVLAELKEAGEGVSSIAHGARALVTDAAAKHGRHTLDRLDSFVSAAVLDQIVDKVLAYKPKPKSRPAKKRARRKKKAQRESCI